MRVLALVLLPGVAANLSPQGPQIGEVFRTASLPVIIIWIICAVCTILSVARYYTHRREIRQMPYSPRRTLFLRIIRLGPVFALTTFLPLFFVRAAPLFEVVRSVQEAAVIHYFALLVLEFLGGKEPCMATLAALPAAKFLNVPPVCWMCKPCASPRPFTRPLFNLSLSLAEQFVYVVPATALLQLWFSLEQAQNHDPVLDLLSLMLDIVKFISITCAMYGLFILFLAVREAILPNRPGLKLLAIKLVVVVGAVQSLIVGLVVSKANGVKNDGNIFSQDYKQEFWRNWMLNVETLPFIFFLARAYPGHELAQAPTWAAAKGGSAALEDGEDTPLVTAADTFVSKQPPRAQYGANRDDFSMSGEYAA